MSEGLVALDREGCVLSVNPAAQAVFGVGRSCVGHRIASAEPAEMMW